MPRDRLPSSFVPPGAGLPADDRQQLGKAPHLLTNPADDEEFNRFAHAVLRRVSGLDAFETALHERYESAAVHERVISGEPWLVWYVYRDGRWVGRSGQGARREAMARSDESSERESDYRATTDSIADSAERVADLEEEKAKLSPSDPTARRLTAEVESEIDKMEREGAVQRSLVEESAEDEAAKDRPSKRQN